MKKYIRNFCKFKNEKGISLITLVITIIVVIILAGAVILTLSQNNIIEDANEAVFRNNMAEYKSALDLYILSEQAENGSTFNPATLNKTGEEIKSIIPSVKDEYINKLEISSGKLKYIVTDENTQEGEWADNIADLEVEHRTDNIAPSVTISSITSTGTEITATIELVDDKSGVELTQSKYIVTTESTVYATDNAIWNTATVLTANPQNISASNLTDGDYYIQLLSVDKSGNRKTSISSKVTIITMITSNPPVNEGEIGTILLKNSTINGEMASYNNPIIPAGFFAVNTTDASWSNISTDYNKGLVIQDMLGNQFVWVPVDGNNVKYERNYTYPSGYSLIPQNISDDTSTLNEIKHSEILASVQANGGFYIARYEAMFEYNGGNIRVGSRKSLNIATTDWSTTRDNTYNGYLLNYISYSDAKEYSSEMSQKYGYTTVATNLISGTEWDTVMDWINDSGKSVTDSRNWGNYSNSISPANVSTYRSLNSSGNVNSWKARNIYDIAGNCSEYTSEKYLEYYVVRSGHYANSGLTYPASYHDLTDNSTKAVNRTFRVAIYILP